MEGTGSIIRLLVKIPIFIGKLLGVNGILFLAILIGFPLAGGIMINQDEEYQRKDSYEIVTADAIQVEKTEDIMTIFTEDWETSYATKVIYKVEMEIKNTGVKPIIVENDIDYIHATDENDSFLTSRRMEYYEAFPDDIYPYNEVIPSGETGTLEYYVAVSEDRIPQTLIIEVGLEAGKVVNIPLN